MKTLEYKEKEDRNRFLKSEKKNKIIAIVFGMGALFWFFVRVIPKPARATYPCQRAAFPVASVFIIWLFGLLSNLFIIKFLKQFWACHRKIVSFVLFGLLVLLLSWLVIVSPDYNGSENIPGINEFVPAIGFDWKPGEPNRPVGIARGINPGRVIMVRNPLATKWAGNWKLNKDQWWLDKNTDLNKVSEMLSITLKTLTSEDTDNQAWDKIFKYHNQNTKGIKNKGYKNDEIVALKINLNNSGPDKNDNLIDASPQLVLAMVRQLVYEAGVPEQNIVIHDILRAIYPAMLTTIWAEFKDVRFVQMKEPDPEVQPVNPHYGNYQGLEAADWVNALSYSDGDYKKAKQTARQILEATYFVNMAILKAHSYPYNYMEDGDEGQTALTMCAKNYCGSINGTWELHSILNTKENGVKNAYSPLVDLSASPNLGAKTILFVLDGLYCGRKWKSYPTHFPNPPFNNKTEPYENPEWPACVLASLDQVALESVGLDILYAQSKNNSEKSYHNVPRIMIRDNADDYLNEMALMDNPPSGTNYIYAGKPLKSLGVHEHWDSDSTMRYSRNFDPEKGKGIELVYIPINE